MSYLELTTEPSKLGKALLKLGVKSAVFEDDITKHLYTFHAISENEFQFGRSGDTLTNYVVEPEPCMSYEEAILRNTDELLVAFIKASSQEGYQEFQEEFSTHLKLAHKLTGEMQDELNTVSDAGKHPNPMHDLESCLWCEHFAYNGATPCRKSVECDPKSALRHFTQLEIDDGPGMVDNQRAIQTWEEYARDTHE